MRKRKGVILILTVGILALITLVGTSFAVNMLLEKKETSNFSNGRKAAYLAEAGISRALCELKFGTEGATQNAVDTTAETWYSGYSDSNLLAGRGSYNVTIIDCARQINLNNKENSRLLQLLDNLNAALGNPLSAAECQSMVTNAPYVTKEEIKIKAGIDKNKYDAIKDYITLYGYKDTNTLLPDDVTHEERSPVNVNTASGPVLFAVIRGPVPSDAKSQALAQAMISSRPFTCWQQFNDFIDNYVGLNPTERKDLKDGINPNNTKPASYTTEFCFHSGGYYELASTGTVTVFGGVAAATRQAHAFVKVFDLWNQTTKDQFAQVWRNDLPANGGEGDPSNGEMARVNFMDTCPVRSDQDWNGVAGTGYDIIKNSIKAGFWDNFSEKVDVYIGQQTDWTNNEWNPIQPLSGLWDTRLDPETGNPSYSSENGLYTGDSASYYPIADLGDMTMERWVWGNHSVQALLDDNITIWQMRNNTGWWRNSADPQFVGHICFRRTNYDASVWQNDEDTGGLNPVNPDWPVPDPGPPPHAGKFMGWLNVLPSPPDVAGRYNLLKTIKVVCFQARFWAYLDGSGMFSDFSGPGTAPKGLVRLYGRFHRPSYDNVRIIPDEGYYTSVPFTRASAVRWGTVTGTITKPSTAIADSEKVILYASTDGGTSFSEAGPGGGIGLSPSTSIQYKAEFLSRDDPSSGIGFEPYYSETAVLEEITVSYLPRTEIVYWQ